MALVQQSIYKTISVKLTHWCTSLGGAYAKMCNNCCNMLSINANDLQKYWYPGWLPIKCLIFLPLLVRTSSAWYGTRDFPIQNGGCFRPGTPSPRGRPRGLPSGPTNSSRRRYCLQKACAFLFRDFEDLPIPELCQPKVREPACFEGWICTDSTTLLTGLVS